MEARYSGGWCTKKLSIGLKSIEAGWWLSGAQSMKHRLTPAESVAIINGLSAITVPDAAGSLELLLTLGQKNFLYLVCSLDA